MRALGVDYGTKRIGIAISDPELRVAFPHTTLANTVRTLDALMALIEENEVRTVVVGDSKTLAGEPNPLAAKAEVFAEDLMGKTGVEVVFEPEYLTTVHATSLQGKTDQADASAAAIILQTYLDTKNHERGKDSI